MSRRLGALFIFLGGLVLLCLQTASASTFPLTVTDVLGRQVTLVAAPQRIVSLAPSTTEQLFAIGAGARVVGVTTHDNYPPQVHALARVGGYVAKSISIEKILGLKPDLVLSRGEIQRPTIEALTRAGLPVVAIEPESFEEVYAATHLLGHLTQQEALATQVVEHMQQRVARVRALVETIPVREQVTVFYKAYDEPLLTAGPATLIGRMIEMAGGKNIFADLAESYPQVSAEEVLRRNPAVILGPSAHGTLQQSARPRRLPGWQHLTAVRTNRVHALDDDLISRPGPRLVAALEAVASALYPAHFPPKTTP